MKQKSETNRVEAGGAGIGEVSDEMIAERARELARADDRDDVGASDLDEAREQLTGRAEELDGDVEESLSEEERAGDGSPPTEHGTQAPRLELDDETSIAEAEIEEGMAEAELDSRVRSARHD